MPNILTKKQYKETQKLNRYSNTPYYYNTVDERFCMGTSKPLKENTTHRIHKVMEGDTIDSLALYYYNNPTYFWVIADFNRIRDPYEALKVGSHIKIPTFSSIEFED